MYIVAGRYGGMRLRSPVSPNARPTSARVREALFSSLGDLEGAVVVDGFAGSGALGCESLSRGAAFCYFVEADRRSVGVIRENLRRIDAADQSVVLEGTFERQLGRVDRDPDLWFFDPPYDSGLGEGAMQALRDSGKASAGTLVVLEQDVDEEVAQIEGFVLEDRRIYGRARLCFFRFEA